MVICRIVDWNRELSPWKAEPVMDDSEGFAGEGRETLNWLTEVCAVRAFKELGGRRRAMLAGYSLAGLFTLWAAYETDIFEGYACCSGSLWFEGWEDFAAKNHVKGKCSIYLSLGGKEEKTDNPVIAGIGRATRRQERLLKDDPNVQRCILEMNPGGHFADSGKRLAKGIRWLVDPRS